MGESKRKKEAKANDKFIFERENYKFMVIGLVVIALGFILMAGGGSDDPNVFNPEIFSWRRIRLAPTVVLIGFAIEVYAILLKPKSSK
jgi:hypothetical protein